MFPSPPARPPPRHLIEQRDYEEWEAWEAWEAQRDFEAWEAGFKAMHDIDEEAELSRDITDVKSEITGSEPGDGDDEIALAVE